ncbi:hypothetical protein L209DRAFT_748610 [Thermothelomyces heterothallicus CBS 203.75]
MREIIPRKHPNRLCIYGDFGDKYKTKRLERAGGHAESNFILQHSVQYIHIREKRSFQQLGRPSTPPCPS